MEEKLYEHPIEELDLEKDIIQKLKDIFIYTIGDLQGKTEEALRETLGFDQYIVGTIQNVLRKKTQMILSKDIQEDDKIEKLDLEPRLVMKLKWYRNMENFRINEVE